MADNYKGIHQATLPEDFKIEIPHLKKEEELYHAFISHSSEDKMVSYYVMEELEKIGFRCFHSDRDFQVSICMGIFYLLPTLSSVRVQQLLCMEVSIPDIN
ncbi:hypothetical protein CEE34_03795 [Candidatus Aerophobetes bacterium Ae_b3a]|nr:MAG: hypothetical protein CEE34_03795 [Candidatus Aerophobetes bacterium Ae_b3a]